MRTFVRASSKVLPANVYAFVELSALRSRIPIGVPVSMIGRSVFVNSE